ncbi:hypothetical protein EVAR_51110_1 [Eumeta japonica]|uniref:Uncharacterized protein n=1 Tax=Eumeta variegata TaxID=151549 RepID=A0A4C1Y9Z6_EUMVA|nr:hypothetical protein EVAR_51110_1 [Eumeta japonica]
MELVIKLELNAERGAKSKQRPKSEWKETKQNEIENRTGVENKCKDGIKIKSVTGMFGVLCITRGFKLKVEGNRQPELDQIENGPAVKTECGTEIKIKSVTGVEIKNLSICRTRAQLRDFIPFPTSPEISVPLVFHCIISRMEFPITLLFAFTPFTLKPDRELNTSRCCRNERVKAKVRRCDELSNEVSSKMHRLKRVTAPSAACLPSDAMPRRDFAKFACAYVHSVVQLHACNTFKMKFGD